MQRWFVLIQRWILTLKSLGNTLKAIFLTFQQPEQLLSAHRNNFPSSTFLQFSLNLSFRQLYFGSRKGFPWWSQHMEVLAPPSVQNRKSGTGYIMKWCWTIPILILLSDLIAVCCLSHEKILLWHPCNVARSAITPIPANSANLYAFHPMTIIAMHCIGPINKKLTNKHIRSNRITSFDIRFIIWPFDRFWIDSWLIFSNFLYISEHNAEKDHNHIKWDASSRW